MRNNGKVPMPICGYIYDPTLADSTQEINPGTAFEALQDTWVCPVAVRRRAILLRKNEGS